MPSQDAHRRYSYVQKYLPLITPRIQFKPSPPPPLPVLTAHTEFRPEDLTATRVQDAVAPRCVVIFQDPATDQVAPSPVDSPSETLTNNITPSSSLGLDTMKIPKPPGQSKEKVAEICQKMQEPDKWPQLEKYEDCWPVISIIKLAVKYKAEATRRNQDKEVSRRIQDAARLNTRATAGA
ncbi:hypothetical protein CPB84DRAFT_1753171 [Gymnopilus junonius]|uniref:Uncharacterized protein n=1 Tax=Gymnopilus junonius TaxID=109634 RepID=A0A9P5TGL3_GYMJU|nr:hypothetical protein CPB84DRAFT_1753171 [Gymnopilus junonius]